MGANISWRGRAPQRTLEDAVTALGALGSVEARSSWWNTAPVGPVREQPPFVNGVVMLRTRLLPGALMEALLLVERQFGRHRGRTVKGPRTLDLDLLLVEREEGSVPVLSDEPELRLPHPELASRRFALAPLAEIAPNAMHPLLGATVRELLRRLPDGQQAERMEG